jgi:hypothetical protein
MGAVLEPFGPCSSSREPRVVNLSTMIAPMTETMTVQMLRPVTPLNPKSAQKADASDDRERDVQHHARVG